MPLYNPLGCSSNAFTVLAVPLVDATAANINQERGFYAKPGRRLKTSAVSSIGKYWIGALSGTRVTPDVGATVSVVGARGLRRRAVTTRTRIIGARVTVVAVCVDHALGFFADTALTDAGAAAVRLAGFTLHGVSADAALVEILACVTELIGTFVLVVLAVFVGPAFTLLCATEPH
jgi:hypothetical protein